MMKQQDIPVVKTNSQKSRPLGFVYWILALTHRTASASEKEQELDGTK
jgi:hypothetical protein